MQILYTLCNIKWKTKLELIWKRVPRFYTIQLDQFLWQLVIMPRYIIMLSLTWSMMYGRPTQLKPVKGPQQPSLFFSWADIFISKLHKTEKSNELQWIRNLHKTQSNLMRNVTRLLATRSFYLGSMLEVDIFQMSGMYECCLLLLQFNSDKFVHIFKFS